ncbi:ABC transporter permease [Streptomyces sp. NPDC059575]|uniref:ABC transporter permease n=1 Tax=Streptomyces sp. NPDC059575 TaxID=3346872 RepID=UPI0036A80823
MTTTAPELHPASTPAAPASTLTGTPALLRFALRRDRVQIPVWAGVNALMVLSMPGTLQGLYATAAERASLRAQLTVNASLRALTGPLLDDSVGGLTAWRAGVYAGLLAAAMSLLIVVRHTRDEEESGRAELLASAAVGRRAPLTAALLAAAVANGVLALLLVAGMATYGAPGALALALGVAGTGLVFAGVAAVAAQLTQSARLARGLTSAVLGAAFVLRAAGDSARADGSSALTWLSPLGWQENLRPYAGERWWVLLLFGGACASLGALAFTLAARRDLGMSFLPTRPGPARGRLGSAAALAWRLQRGALFGWGVGFFLAGVVYGGLTQGAARMMGDNEGVRQILERMGGRAGAEDAFLAAMTGMLGLVAALYIVSSVLRLASEETSGRAEPILACAVGRLRWAAGHLTVSFAGSALLMLLAALGLLAGYGHRPGTLLSACLIQLPAIWTLGALTVLLYGVLPRAATIAWAAAGATVLLGWVGPAVNAPRLLLDLSPYAHLPKLPAAPMEWTPVAALLTLTIALTCVGLTGIRRRDLTG